MEVLATEAAECGTAPWADSPAEADLAVAAAADLAAADLVDLVAEVSAAAEQAVRGNLRPLLS